VNLTCVGPLPPVRSGVADYSAQLLTYLRPYCERLTAVLDGTMPEPDPGVLDCVRDARSASPYCWADGDSVCLYHMGNQPRYHQYVYDMLRRVPGITVLHDGNLLPFIHEVTLGQGDRASFVREAGLERGNAGLKAAWAALRGGGPLQLEAYPMLARVARASLGVIVHSTGLLERVRSVAPGAPAVALPHLDLVVGDEHGRAPTAKPAVGFGNGDLLVGAFGFIAPSRRLEQALRAFARVNAEHPRARFVCVGEISPGYRFEDVLAALGMTDKVRVTGYVPHDELERYLQAVDVGVNLRWPTWGEMSGTLMRLMAFGVPTLVTNAGAFAELPEAAVVKIRPDDGEVDQMVGALRQLLGDAGARHAVGAAARTYVAQHCSPTSVARRYAEFIREVVGLT
jgi:glycosyltransferase involved in cell wall biosynthesis